MSSFSLRRDIPLIVAAIFISFVIWLIAVQRDRDMQYGVEVPILPVNVPTNMEVKIVPASVSINVQYPRDQRSRIVPQNFAATVDASAVFGTDLSKWSDPEQVRSATYNLTPGQDVIPLENRLPKEVNIINVSPPTVSLKASLKVRKVTVEVATTGVLSNEYQISGAPVPQPSEVYITGSPEALAMVANKGNKLRTEPVDLTSLSKTRTQLLSRDLIVPPGVTLVNDGDKTINVNIGLEERPETRVITGVPVTLPLLSPDLKMKITPEKVDIKVEGPPSALNQILADSFSFTTSSRLEERVGRPQEVVLQASLLARVKANIGEQIKILEVTPPRISVEFLQANSQTVEPAATPKTGK